MPHGIRHPGIRTLHRESWLLGRVFRLAARAGVRAIVAFSDPVPRTNPAGRLVMPGHVGICYQAHNGVYLGRATARTLTVLPDGSILSARSAAKVTGLERGRQGVTARLFALGAPAPEPSEAPARWLARSLDQIGAIKLRHPGNHRYAWALRASVRIAMASHPYPKQDTEAYAGAR